MTSADSGKPVFDLATLKASHFGRGGSRKTDGEGWLIFCYRFQMGNDVQSFCLVSFYLPSIASAFATISSADMW